MNVLVIGGAGSVASVVIPHLRKLHTLRVFDLRPPADTSLEHMVGNVGDYEALKSASMGMDAILYMAMGHLKWEEPIGFTSAFDANVKGVYVALRAAHSAGVPHAVYTSSMSVFEGDLLHRYFYDEEQPADGHALDRVEEIGSQTLLADFSELFRHACLVYWPTPSNARD